MHTGKKNLYKSGNTDRRNANTHKKLALMEIPRSSQETPEAKNLDCNILKVLRRERKRRRRRGNPIDLELYTSLNYYSE